VLHRRSAVVAAISAIIVGSAAVPTAPPTLASAVTDTVDGRFAGGGMREAGSVLELDVAGRGGSATNASAVSLNLTVTQSGGPGYATVYPCGAARPAASSVNYGPGATIANGIISQVGTGGAVCIYTHTRAHVVVDLDGWFPIDAKYRSLSPARLLDTRPGSATVDGRAAGVGLRPAGSVLELDVADRGGTGSKPTAVVVNVTATDTRAPGFATVHPCGSRRPTASTINYGPGTTVANSLLAKVGDDGRLCIYTHAAAHFVVDVAGFFAAGADYRPLTPARLLDTRPGSDTVDGRSAGAGLRPAGSVLELDVTERGGSAATAEAVSLNVTATETHGPGFVTVYPCGAARPEASSVNYRPGQTIANGIIAKVGAGGKVCIHTHAPAHIVVDLNGFFPSGSDYRPSTPARLLDTRPAQPLAPVDAAVATSLSLLNQLRAAHGVGPVAVDTAMSAEALAWSDEMSRSGFRHSSLNYAENIAWHSAPMSPEVAATTLHDMWVASSSHFRNMVDPRWTRVGIGLHLDGSGWWGTHVFSP